MDVIRYKTGGRQKPFAEFMGWTPPYLAKLLRGENFGLQPVLSLLEKLPEINARWLLLGQGSMLNDDMSSVCVVRPILACRASLLSTDTSP